MSEQRAGEYWGSFFGLPPQELAHPGLRVVPHAGLGDYPGAWIFWRGDTVLLSAPEELVPDLQAATAKEAACAPAELSRHFRACTERLIGPAYQGFLDPIWFRPSEDSAAAPLLPGDPRLQALCTACDPQEWSHAGIDSGRPEPCFGYRLGDRLVAAAQNAYWAEATVSPGLIVHPDYRGRGYGKAVLSAVVSDALRQDHLVLYQTLSSNTPAIRAAESLGFRPYATHLAIRFRGK